ncbi:DUF402 domain-containing protein [Mycoplasmopsis hyopharyngis]|uniref:DUF402 domain-containing protein n=1 Tax=Mycoplasmopsis hyopharyngis TaxID=29558 RepID=UPI003872FF04
MEDQQRKLTKNLTKFKKVNVQAYKFDGTLYRQWNKALILRDTADHYVLLLKRTRVYEIPYSTWTYKEYVLWFLPKKSMYNALIILKPNENFVYVNLASTPIFENNTLKFVDYDLDIKAYPGQEFKIVDKEEFIDNAKKFGYPKKMISNVFKNLNELIYKYNTFNYFFNNTIVEYYVDIAKKNNLINKNFREQIKPGYIKSHTPFYIKYDLDTLKVNLLKKKELSHSTNSVNKKKIEK